MKTAEQIEQEKQIHKFMLQDIEWILPRFSNKINDLIKVIDYNESDDFRLEIYPKLTSGIDNPLEDVIRYRYIVAIEYFRVISSAIRNKYFSYSYNKMNKEILDNKIARKHLKGFSDYDIQTVLDTRNYLAHNFMDSTIFINEMTNKNMINNLEFLKKVLELYVTWVKSKTNSHN
jgi:hypothetical protein